MYKTLTCEAVVRAAEALMHQNGTTTTREVKNQLRAEGYLAEHREVSYFMQHLALIEGWTWRDDAQGRHYGIADSASAVLTACYVLHLN